MNNSSFGKIACTVAILCMAGAAVASAQTLTTVVNFNGTNGYQPWALIQGTDGNFYGTTPFGGASTHCSYRYGCGTIFKLAPDGNLTTLHNFCHASNCPDGQNPGAGLVEGADGNLYGTALDTVFKITPSGIFTRLYSFCPLQNCSTGSGPSGSLVQGTDGNFYGTTEYGGTSASAGTIYKITPTGKLTVLYKFCSLENCADGGNPMTGLILATNGKFYGTTSSGGPYSGGTVFEITATGKFSTVYSFTSAEVSPSSLTESTGGNLFGTTTFGGAFDFGTAFEITRTGKYQVRYTFCSNIDCPDGGKPSSLLQGSDGNLYGVTYIGGGSVKGTMFELTPTGSLTTLYSFCMETNCIDGAAPAFVIQSTDGSFYGTTGLGGNSNDGTVFRLSTGLGPFVEAEPNLGQPGRVIRILGNSLTGTASVTFNGTPAKFEVVSDTYLKAEVPGGATAGQIVVTTPSDQLDSNVPFQVLP